MISDKNTEYFIHVFFYYEQLDLGYLFILQWNSIILLTSTILKVL